MAFTLGNFSSVCRQRLRQEFDLLYNCTQLECPHDCQSHFWSSPSCQLLLTMGDESRTSYFSFNLLEAEYFLSE